MAKKGKDKQTNKSTHDTTQKTILSGPIIAYYAVWVLLNVEGRTVTYSC